LVAESKILHFVLKVVALGKTKHFGKQVAADGGGDFATILPIDKFFMEGKSTPFLG
jgi:hypothetical protein